MTHAWCTDPARDAAVRAAEDNRTGPLPTLEEAIVLAFGFDKASAQRACDEVNSWPEDVQKDCRFVLGNLLEQGVERLQALVEAWRWGKGLLAARYPAMFPKNDSASSPVEHENKGDGMATDGMRTERITLEVTGAPGWRVEVNGIDVESVRVVEVPKLAPRANDDGGSNHAAQAASGGGQQPRGWLTQEEREALRYSSQGLREAGGISNVQAMKQIDALLARSSPPEVVWPESCPRGGIGETWERARDGMWIAAIVAAGVAVKENSK